MKPSEQAQADYDALRLLLESLDKNIGLILGGRITSSAGEIGPVESIVLIMGTGADARDAKRRLSEAAGRAAEAWARWGSGAVDPCSAWQQINPGTDLSAAEEQLLSVEIPLRAAMGRAMQAKESADRRESNRFIWALAWYVRLPQEVADAAGMNNERSGRIVGRLVQLLPVVAAAGAAVMKGL